MRFILGLLIVGTASLLMQCSSRTMTRRHPLPTPILPDTGLSALAVRPADVSTGATRSPVEWRYRFVTGEKLHYRRTWIQQSERSGDYHHVTEAMVEVESVDAEGNGTLLITIVDEMKQDNLDGIRQPVDRTRKQVRSSYSQSIPKIRVVVDPHGGFIAGQILEEAADHLAFLEMAKQPGVVSHSISDDRRLQLEVEQWLPALTVRPHTAIGDEWIDTLVESRRVMRFSLDRDTKDSTTLPGAGATEKNEAPRSEIRRYNSYRIASLVQKGTDAYVKVDGSGIVEQDLMENQMYVARSNRHDLFRAADGLPVLLKTTGRSGIDGDERTYYEVVLELLSK